MDYSSASSPCLSAPPSGHLAASVVDAKVGAGSSASGRQPRVAAARPAGAAGPGYPRIANLAGREATSKVRTATAVSGRVPVRGSSAALAARNTSSSSSSSTRPSSSTAKEDPPTSSAAAPRPTSASSTQARQQPPARPASSAEPPRSARSRKAALPQKKSASVAPKGEQSSTKPGTDKAPAAVQVQSSTDAAKQQPGKAPEATMACSGGEGEDARQHVGEARSEEEEDVGATRKEGLAKEEEAEEGAEGVPCVAEKGESALREGGGAETPHSSRELQPDETATLDRLGVQEEEFVEAYRAGDFGGLSVEAALEQLVMEEEEARTHEKQQEDDDEEEEDDDRGIEEEVARADEGEAMAIERFTKRASLLLEASRTAPAQPRATAAAPVAKPPAPEDPDCGTTGSAQFDEDEDEDAWFGGEGSGAGVACAAEQLCVRGGGQLLELYLGMAAALPGGIHGKALLQAGYLTETETRRLEMGAALSHASVERCWRKARSQAEGLVAGRG